MYLIYISYIYFHFMNHLIYKNTIRMSNFHFLSFQFQFQFHLKQGANSFNYFFSCIIAFTCNMDWDYDFTPKALGTSGNSCLRHLSSLAVIYQVLSSISLRMCDTLITLLAKVMNFSHWAPQLPAQHVQLVQIIFCKLDLQHALPLGCLQITLLSHLDYSQHHSILFLNVSISLCEAMSNRWHYLYRKWFYMLYINNFVQVRIVSYSLQNHPDK